MQSVEADIFAEEILPIEVRGKVFSKDDTIRLGVTAESLAKLKPAFPQWGNSTTTAGNASGIGDGAGLCIMTTREIAQREGMPILGKWVGSAVVGKCQSVKKDVGAYSSKVSNQDTWVFPP